MALGIVYVANRSGQVENSDASMGFPGAYVQQENEPGMMGLPVPGQPEQMLGTNEENIQNPMIRQDAMNPVGKSFTNTEGFCNCDFPSELNVVIECTKGAEKTYVKTDSGNISDGSDGWDVGEVDEKSSATVFRAEGTEGPISPKETCKNNGDCKGKCSAPTLNPEILKKASKETGKTCLMIPATEEARIRDGSVSCRLQ
jgi:hypothetical protein